MPVLTCRRCRTPLAPIFPGQTEHPLCSPTPTGWIPAPTWIRGELTGEPISPGLALALELAALGWHLFPLAAASKKPLANCRNCTSHDPDGCPCLLAGRWCHGVRAATTDSRRLTAWWQAEPTAVPGVAAGPSGLVLIDLDAHGTHLPPNLATGLLPGINLTAEPIHPARWTDPERFRDGRDTLRLLAELRGGPHPWPADPGHQPVTVTTPSGGRHLWYRAPSPGLRQANSDPQGRHGLGWQIDIKAGWSHGLAPGATIRTSNYRILSGDPHSPGDMPGWLASEITRVCRPTSCPAPPPTPRSQRPSRDGAAYLTRVIDRGAHQLAQLTDGRKRALAALAYQAGGLLAWSGLTQAEVAEKLVNAGTTAGLSQNDARSRVTRSLANGVAHPIMPAPVGHSKRIA